MEGLLARKVPQYPARIVPIKRLRSTSRPWWVLHTNWRETIMDWERRFR